MNLNLILMDENSNMRQQCAVAAQRANHTTVSWMASEAE